MENIKGNTEIIYVGPLTLEKDIKKYMIKANYVFNPGDSGLHINHSLCYGEPFITLKRKNHGPEIDYLIDNYNGYLLEGKKDIDIERLCKIFLDIMMIFIITPMIPKKFIYRQMVQANH